MFWKAAGGEPLSPDSLTIWNNIGREIHDKIISKAASFILTTQVHKLTVHLISSPQTTELVNLSTEFHKFGVNLRHLFLVFLKIQGFLEIP
jgi:hypothetical protein